MKKDKGDKIREFAKSSKKFLYDLIFVLIFKVVCWVYQLLLQLFRQQHLKWNSAVKIGCIINVQSYTLYGFNSKYSTIIFKLY